MASRLDRHKRHDIILHMSPSDQSPILPSMPSQDPPVVAPPPAVFHNPLAAGYEDKTTALPPLSTHDTSVAAPTQEYVQPAPQPQPEPSVLDLQDHVMPPPPVSVGTVRLAAVPRGNDLHAQGLAASAHGEPFGAPVAPHVAEAASLPLSSPAGTSRGNSLMVKLAVIAGLLLLLGGGGLLAYKALGTKKVTPSSTPTPTSVSKRDTSQKQLPLGYVQTQTDCYTVQVPTNPEVQLNRDCRLSLTYGEKKTSSIVISPYKDFDLVGSSDTSTDQSKASTFDSRKILEGLISSTTAGRTVAERQDIKVGNIDTVKITSSSTTNGEIVAYAFIVLPVSDQKFAEKSFIAFIVTGAYSDDASKVAFDHVLQSWQWQ